MLRLVIKFIIYSIILWAFSAMGLTDLLVKQCFILGAVLAGVNTLIRPILVALALPINFITFGLTSVFANLLALVIANAMVGGPLSGFWVMLLVSFIIMLADDTHRIIRRRIMRLRLRLV